MITTTRTETVPVGREIVFVKREDLCTEPPAPPFSKMRGLIKYLTHLKSLGVANVGYVESSISMAGWGVAWGCKTLGMNAIIYDPQYSNTTPALLEYHRTKWRELQATVLPIKASMVKVNYNICRNQFRKDFPTKTSIMLPLGIPLQETVNETHLELKNTLIEQRHHRIKTIVVCVGSGTICAGLLKGVQFKEAPHIKGVLCRSGDLKQKIKKIYRKAGVVCSGLFGYDNLELIDMGWEYTQPCELPVPFPCHPYYDAKAWQWLCTNINHLEHPVLFWNIGSLPNDVNTSSVL